MSSYINHNKIESLFVDKAKMILLNEKRQEKYDVDDRIKVCVAYKGTFHPPTGTLRTVAQIIYI